MLLIVIDPSIFVPVEQFKTEVDNLIKKIKLNRPESGVEEILIPGERAYREREKNMLSGLQLDEALLSQLIDRQ